MLQKLIDHPFYTLTVLWFFSVEQLVFLAPECDQVIQLGCGEVAGVEAVGRHAVPEGENTCPSVPFPLPRI